MCIAARASSRGNEKQDELWSDLRCAICRTWQYGYFFRDSAISDISSVPSRSGRDMYCMSKSLFSIVVSGQEFMVGGAVMLPLCHRLVENIVCQQFDEIVHGGLFLRAAKCFGSRYVGEVAEFAVEILRFVLVVVETDFYAYGKAYFAGYGLFLWTGSMVGATEVCS